MRRRELRRGLRDAAGCLGCKGGGKVRRREPTRGEEQQAGFLWRERAWCVRGANIFQRWQ